MSVEKKIGIYKRKITDKEIRQYTNKIIKALQDEGITVTPVEASEIMWIPHLVIRDIKGKKIYDASQPLCFSERKLLPSRAKIAYEIYCSEKNQYGQKPA
jgi:hypothetical protein